MRNPDEYDGPERRKCTPEERRRWALEHLREREDFGSLTTVLQRKRGSTTKLILSLVGIISTAVGGLVYVQQRRAPGTETPGSSRDHERHLSEIETRLASHATEVQAFQAEARRDRERFEDRLQAIDRKLDMLLLKAGIQMGRKEGDAPTSVGAP